MEQVITGGGIAGLVAATVYVGRLVLDWRKDKREGPSVHVTSASTANAVLAQTIESLQKENSRLIERVIFLEGEDRRKAAKITELEQRLSVIADELAQLKSGTEWRGVVE